MAAANLIKIRQALIFFRVPSETLITKGKLKDNNDLKSNNGSCSNSNSNQKLNNDDDDNNNINSNSDNDN